MKRFIRLLLIPIGLFKGLIALFNSGSRDIQNKLRFKKTTIHEGCTLDDRCVLDAFVYLGANCILNNVKVESYSYIARNSLVQNTDIGRFCSIANDVFIGLGTHPTDKLSTSPLFYHRHNPFGVRLGNNDLFKDDYQRISIGHDVWIGARATILDGITIGHGAIVATGAVVTKDVPPYAIVAGIPAKVVKYRFDHEKIKSLLESEWWKLDPKTIFTSYYHHEQHTH